VELALGVEGYVVAGSCATRAGEAESATGWNVAVRLSRGVSAGRGGREGRRGWETRTVGESRGMSSSAALRSVFSYCILS